MFSHLSPSSEEAAPGPWVMRSGSTGQEHLSDVELFWMGMGVELEAWRPTTRRTNVIDS